MRVGTVRTRGCTLQAPSFPPVSAASHAHRLDTPPSESLFHGTFTLKMVGSLHRTKKPNKHHTKKMWTSGKSFCNKDLGFCTLGNGAVEEELNTDDPGDDGGCDAMRAFIKSMFGSSLVGRDDWGILGFPIAAPMPRARMNSDCWPSDHTDGSTGPDEVRCNRGAGVGSGSSGGSSPMNAATDGLSATGSSK